MKPLYYVYVRCEEQVGDPDCDLLAFYAVYNEPAETHGQEFPDIWNQAKEACRAESCWGVGDILEKLRDWGWLIHDHAEVPVYHVEC